METRERKCFVYAHIREDKNEIFYIGIGSINKVYKYKRSKQKDKRNKIWNNIVKKTSYSVKILEEGLSWEEACRKEIELIKFYGKIKDHTGTLSNITDGGEGAVGYKPTEEIIRRHSERMRGRKVSEETRKKQSLIQRHKVVAKEVGLKISKSKLGKSPSKKSINNKKYLKHVSSNLVFPSINLAADHFQIRAGLLGRDLLSGKNTDFVNISKEEFEEVIKNSNQVFPRIKRKPFTEERKKKISQRMLGRVFSVETREKLSKSLTGKKVSKEARKNMSDKSASNIPIRNCLTNESYKNITDAAKTVTIGVAGLAIQLRTGYPFCIFEYLNNPVSRKKAKMFKNTETNEYFLNIKDVAKKEKLKISAADARTRRKSKNWNYIPVEVDFVELLKNKELIYGR